MLVMGVALLAFGFLALAEMAALLDRSADGAWIRCAWVSESLSFVLACFIVVAALVLATGLIEARDHRPGFVDLAAMTAFVLAAVAFRTWRCQKY